MNRTADFVYPCMSWEGGLLLFPPYVNTKISEVKMYIHDDWWYWLLPEVWLWVLSIIDFGFFGLNFSFIKVAQRRRAARNLAIWKAARSIRLSRWPIQVSRQSCELGPKSVRLIIHLLSFSAVKPKKKWRIDKSSNEDIPKLVRWLWMKLNFLIRTEHRGLN